MKKNLRHLHEVGQVTLLISLSVLPNTALGQNKLDLIATNQVEAKVNDRVITESQVAILLAPAKALLVKRFPGQGPEYDRLLEKSRKNILQELIDRQKLIARLNQPKVQIKQDAIENEVQREIRDNYKGDVDQFRAALRVNRMTMDGFRLLVQDRLLEHALRSREAPKK